MRKVITAVVLLASSLALLHCAGSPATDSSDAGPQVSQQTEGDAATPVQDSSAPKPSAVDAAPAPKDAAKDATRPPPPADAAPPPPPDTPGPECQSLGSCCNTLDPISSVGCLLLSGKKDELLCTGGIVTFGCGTGGGGLLGSILNGGGSGVGPNCGQLSACCNSNQYIQTDQACTTDVDQGDEDLCEQDLQSYQSDAYGDCL